MQHAARKYLDQHVWDVYYKGAYIKMVTSFATWSPAAAAHPYTIYGNECVSGTVIDPTCAQDAPGPMGHEASTLWNTCTNCTTGASRVVGVCCHGLRWRASAAGADGGVRVTMQLSAKVPTIACAPRPAATDGCHYETCCQCFNNPAIKQKRE